jgi:hypothetical protein
MGKGETRSDMMVVVEYCHRKADGTIITKGRRITDWLGRVRTKQSGIDINGKKYEIVTGDDGKVLFKSTGNILIDMWRKVKLIL